MAEAITAERRIELLETLLSAVIADFGYPCGCGVPPHPADVRKLAENCFKVATHQP